MFLSDFFCYFTLSGVYSKRVILMANQQLLEHYRLRLSEEEIQHHSYADEREFYRLVRDCDIDGLFAYYDRFPRQLVGQMADNPVKQQEYITVLGVSMIVRIAIEAGLDPYEGYNLNDVFLQRTSKASSIEEYEAILRESARVIIEHLKRHLAVRAKSVHIKKAREYVSKHISQPFCLGDVAAYVGISCSRLSVLFSQLEHQTIHDYILDQRMNTAKELLCFSDRTVADIANYLCFSSHSHFSDVFKKRVGMTPTQYREEHYAE